MCPESSSAHVCAHIDVYYYCCVVFERVFEVKLAAKFFSYIRLRDPRSLCIIYKLLFSRLVPTYYCVYIYICTLFFASAAAVYKMIVDRVYNIRYIPRYKLCFKKYRVYNIIRIGTSTMYKNNIIKKEYYI